MLVAKMPQVNQQKPETMLFAECTAINYNNMYSSGGDSFSAITLFLSLGTIIEYPLIFKKFTMKCV